MDEQLKTGRASTTITDAGALGLFTDLARALAALRSAEDAMRIAPIDAKILLDRAKTVDILLKRVADAAASGQSISASDMALAEAAKQVCDRILQRKAAPAKRSDSLIAEVYGGFVGGFAGGGVTGLIFGGKGFLIGAAVGAVGGAVQGAVKYFIKRTW